MSAVETPATLSRRAFLTGSVKVTAGLGGAVVLMSSTACDSDTVETLGTTAVMPERFAAMVQLNPNGRVDLQVPRVEMGQGVNASAQFLLASVSGIATSDIDTKMADADPHLGDQFTAASSSAMTLSRDIPPIAAALNWLIREAAARRLSVPMTQLRVQDSKVYLGDEEKHALADLVTDIDTARLPYEVDLPVSTAAAEPQVDPTLVDGTMPYAGDLRLPGMKFAVAMRPPLHGANLKGWSVEPDVQKQMDALGAQVLKVDHYRTPEHLFVVADTTYHALSARELVKTEWDLSDVATGSQKSSDLNEQVFYQALQQSLKSERNKTFSRTYRAPYVNATPLEPPVCVARCTQTECEIWAPVQVPQQVRAQVAAATGIDESAIVLHITRIGGGFGRKTTDDFVVETVVLSQRLGQTVQLFWSREDDLRHGYYRPAAIQRLGVDDPDNASSAVSYDIAAARAEYHGAAGVATPLWEFDWPLDLDLQAIDGPLRTGLWRAVDNVFHAFAINSFIDEWAQHLERDPVEFHLEHLRSLSFKERAKLEYNPDYKFDPSRYEAVVKRAQRLANWNNSTQGFAAMYVNMSYVATIFDVNGVDLSGANPDWSKASVTVVVDCGRVLHRDSVISQIDSSVIYALGAALSAQIKFDASGISTDNFDRYEVLRLSQTPVIQSDIIESDVASSGIGEPVVPTVAPALTNALARVLGRRFYELPVVV